MIPQASFTAASPVFPEQVRLAGLVGGLVYDLQRGSLSQRRLRDHYGIHLWNHVPCLQALKTHPSHPLDTSLLIRFAGCRQRKTGTIVDSVELRRAAEAVYFRVRRSLATFEDLLVRSAVDAFRSPERFSETAPTPDQLRAAFDRFSTDLRHSLNRHANHLIKTRRGHSYRGSDFTINPNFFRAVVLDWYLQTVKEKADCRLEELRRGECRYADFVRQTKGLVEVYDWLACLPINFCHDFFQMLLRDPWIRGKGGIRYVKGMVDQLNRIHHTSFRIGTAQVRIAASPSRSCYHVKKCAPMPELIRSFQHIIPDASIRQGIIHSAKMPDWMFFSIGFAEGLCRAFMFYEESLRNETDGDKRRLHLAALGFILDLFIGKRPLIKPLEFFRRRLIHAHISLSRQREIAEAINAAWGTDYRIVFRTSVWPIAGKMMRELFSKTFERLRPSNRVRQGNQRPPAADLPRGTKPPVQRRFLPKRMIVTEPPLFKKGQYVVYPGVGIGIIDSVRMDEIGGQETPTYVIECETAHGPLRSYVPLASEGVVGLRPLASEAACQQALQMIGRGRQRFSQNNLKKKIERCELLFREGSPEKVAELLNLLAAIRGGESASDPWHFRHFDRGLDSLAGEIALVLKMPKAEAECILLEKLNRQNGLQAEV